MNDPWRSRITGHGEEDPSQLLANPRNWRIHPKAQQDALTAVLDKVGWVQDVIVNKTTGHVLDGHLRVGLAISREEESIPVVYVELTEDEEALILATFDPLGALAGTDDEILRSLVSDIGDQPPELAALLDGLERALERAPGKTDPDAVPDVPDEPISKPGDLWILGDHRLLCGDSTAAGDVDRLLGGGEPALCVTDPPYGVNYDPGWRNDEAKIPSRKGKPANWGHKYSPGKVTNDDRADWGDTWRLFPGDVLYSWHPPGATSLVHAAAIQGSGFVIRMQIIWAKSHFPIGRGDYHVQHEPCWYAVRKDKPAKRTNDRKQTTLWEISGRAGDLRIRLDKNVEGGHSAQKPAECMARPIRNHEFSEVYDPFVGSGTTIIAAEQLGRKCYAMEIEPKYVDVCVNRWEDFTGRKAKRSRKRDP